MMKTKRDQWIEEKKKQKEEAEKKNQWLEKRKKGIGGSDIAGIMGLSKWKTPFSVFMDKMGRLEKQEDNNFLYWGIKLESLIADEFCVQAKKQVEKKESILKHPEYDFIMANIDRNVIDENAGLECKTAIAFKANDFKDKIPDDYMLQCQHYMYVCGYTHYYLAVLIGGNDFRWFQIERDEDICRLIEKKCSDFWKNHILTGIPPEVCADDIDLLTKLNMNDNNNSIELSEDFYKQIEKYDLIKKNIKSLEKEADDVKAKICNVMGENQIAICNDYLIKWKSVESQRIDTAKLKEAGIYNSYCLISKTRRFEIKRK